MSDHARTDRCRWRPFTLADGLAQPQDNFLLLCMLAAAAVVYGHSYALAAHRGPPEAFAWLGGDTYSGAPRAGAGQASPAVRSRAMRCSTVVNATLSRRYTGNACSGATPRPARARGAARRAMSAACG